MDYFWKKKDYVYFVLSILVFLIHISSFAQYSGNEGIISVINSKVSYFFKYSITRLRYRCILFCRECFSLGITQTKSIFQKLNHAFFHCVFHI